MTELDGVARRVLSVVPTTFWPGVQTGHLFVQGWALLGMGQWRMEWNGDALIVDGVGCVPRMYCQYWLMQQIGPVGNMGAGWGPGCCCQKEKHHQ